MKELNRTDRLTIATVLLAIVFIIGLVTMRQPDIPFSLTASQTLDQITTSSDLISPEEVMKIVTHNDNGNLIIDLRSPVDYRRSHIDNATNIPIQELLSKESMAFFEEAKSQGAIIVLYGKDQLEANSAWMILRQIGFDNLRVMPGGFKYYSCLVNKFEDPEISKTLIVDEPLVNFKAVLDSLGTPGSRPEVTERPEPVKIIKREKKSAAEGGC
jgi:rhodanese-related sulfurtransferase